MERPKLTQEEVKDVFGVGQNVLVRAGTKWETREILGITVLRHDAHCPHCGAELLGEPRFWFKAHGNVSLGEIIAREDIGPVITPMMESSEDTIEDGFGSAWSAYCPKCGEKSMSVVRPGKAQCSNCG